MRLDRVSREDEIVVTLAAHIENREHDVYAADPALLGSTVLFVCACLFLIKKKEERKKKRKKKKRKKEKKEERGKKGTYRRFAYLPAYMIGTCVVRARPSLMTIRNGRNE